jgi:formylglycine-generating enzyme required for sulfatase activity
LDEIGWYCDNANSETHPVGQKKPNDWELYDMSGNVWEYVWDCYAPYEVGDVINPTGPETCPMGTDTLSGRAKRGGDFYWNSQESRSAKREYRLAVVVGAMIFKPIFTGFRLVRTLPPPP